MKQLLSALTLSAIFSATAFAAATFTIVPVTLNPVPGQTGSGEILLTNNNPVSINVAVFSWFISTADPDVTFTAADTSTSLAPYIFPLDSFDILNGFTLNSNALPDSMINASDLLNTANTDVTIGAGVTVSLGEFFYHVADTAALGPFSIDFSNPVGDSLSDSLGNAVASNLGSNLTLQITPEPAAFLPMLLIAAGAIVRVGRRRG